ncbi:MAG: response regulator [Chloroflexi bacterium]|nr:response regulator [Chloroflexota bacterium]
MNIRRFERRQAKQALPDALLSIAASLQDPDAAKDPLEHIAAALSEHEVSCALFTQLPSGGGLRLEQTTIPLASDARDGPVHLPRIAAALTRAEPLAYSDIREAFTDTPATGGRRPLLTERVSGTLIAAPLRAADGTNAVLCLVSRRLSDGDRNAAWSLALQLGSALGAARPANGPAQTAQSQAQEGDLSLFHELTRRFSFSLTSEEIIRTAVEVLTPALGLQLAASVACRSGEDLVTIYLPPDSAQELAGNTAAAALDAFVRLTGNAHEGCKRLPYQSARLPAKGGRRSDGGAASVLDAPLVIGGDVIGLLRAASPTPGAFDNAAERTFYTVANQVSLALERVTLQREAERASLASLADSLSDGIVLVDAELRVTSLNSAAHRHLETLVGVPLAEGANLSDTPLAGMTREALSSGKPTALRDLPTNPAAAERRYGVAMSAPLAGSPEGTAAVVILRDVTEERLMQERLLQSEKMVSVGQLVSGVAHELNNPLTGIMGFAQLLLARDLDEKTQRDVSTIYAEAERAAKIVQNLLSFARRRRADKEPANLNALMERVLGLRSYDLRVKSIDVELDLDPTLPETMVDADQIQQVFLNLIINAEQAMLSAGERGVLKVRSWQEGGAIRLSLQDDGPGMQPETLRRIFDPFFTTKQTGEGTGLGLTISYGIIQDHGGRIWAESQPGRGTTFILELPIIEGVRPRTLVEEALAAADQGHAILVVDDEESIQRLLGSILEIDGHHVDTASNGVEALERVSQRHYDVVITDIKMPEMDGPTLHQQLQKVNRRLAERTVFITGDTVSPETREFLQRVQNPCIAKPFRVRQVRETISRILSDDG